MGGGGAEADGGTGAVRARRGRAMRCGRASADAPPRIAGNSGARTNRAAVSGSHAHMGRKAVAVGFCRAPVLSFGMPSGKTFGRSGGAPSGAIAVGGEQKNAGRKQTPRAFPTECRQEITIRRRVGVSVPTRRALVTRGSNNPTPPPPARGPAKVGSGRRACDVGTGRSARCVVCCQSNAGGKRFVTSAHGRLAGEVRGRSCCRRARSPRAVKFARRAPRSWSARVCAIAVGGRDRWRRRQPIHVCEYGV